jgi:hypothetical protein
MKHSFLSRTLVASLFGCGVIYAAEPAPDLVVHEWGTFTSMQGSNGIALEGLQHEEEGLPPFVYSIGKMHGIRMTEEVDKKGLQFKVTQVTEKMETPVLYFYSDRAQVVDVQARFEHGILSQWYPHATSVMHMNDDSAKRDFLDMSHVTWSALQWHVKVLPHGASASLPTVAADDPWHFARIPNANIVRTGQPLGEDGNKKPAEDEKFLFYRGLGRFELPITATVDTGSRLTLSTTARDGIKHLFILHVQDGRGAFKAVPALDRGTPLEIDCPLDEHAEPIDAMVARLSADIRIALVQEGLFPKEAEAMTLTWQKSWLRSEGLRVLYVLPDALTSKILPLTITPKPAALERVMIGRLECIQPEVETSVVGALHDLDSKDDHARADAEKVLARLGRFCEAHVRRALTLSNDALVQANGTSILARIASGG